MSMYIYLYFDRIIYWRPVTAFYKPIGSLPNVRWYMVYSAPPLPMDDVVALENYSYNLQKGFFPINEDWPLAWSERGNVINQIKIMERLTGLANTQKMKFTDNSVGQSLADILLIDEIREYRKSSSLENCAIMTSLLETTQSGMTPDALATKLWLQYESYRTVIAYLNRLEFAIMQLIKVNQFDKANELISNEFEKMKM